MYDPASEAGASGRCPVSSRMRIRSGSIGKDKVWLTEWSANALVRFDPVTENSTAFRRTARARDVRQMLGRAGEAWGAESGNARLVMVPAH